MGCADELTAQYISDRSGEVSIQVKSHARQLGTIRLTNYTPEYRETSGVGRRKLLTMDEVLRLPITKALVIVRGKKLLEVDKCDYTKHPEASKLRDCKASAHIPAWREAQNEKKTQPMTKTQEEVKAPQSKPKVKETDKKSILRKGIP